MFIRGTNRSAIIVSDFTEGLYPYSGYIVCEYTKTTDPATIELPAMLTVSQPLYAAAPQSAAQAELTAGIEEV